MIFSTCLAQLLLIGTVMRSHQDRFRRRVPEGNEFKFAKITVPDSFDEVNSNSCDVVMDLFQYKTWSYPVRYAFAKIISKIESQTEIRFYKEYLDIIQRNAEVFPMVGRYGDHRPFKGFTRRLDYNLGYFAKTEFSVVNRVMESLGLLSPINYPNRDTFYSINWDNLENHKDCRLRFTKYRKLDMKDIRRSELWKSTQFPGGRMCKICNAQRLVTIKGQPDATRYYEAEPPANVNEKEYEQHMLTLKNYYKDQFCKMTYKNIEMRDDDK